MNTKEGAREALEAMETPFQGCIAFSIGACDCVEGSAPGAEPGRKYASSCGAVQRLMRTGCMHMWIARPQKEPTICSSTFSLGRRRSESVCGWHPGMSHECWHAGIPKLWQDVWHVLCVPDASAPAGEARAGYDRP